MFEDDSWLALLVQAPVQRRHPQRRVGDQVAQARQPRKDAWGGGAVEKVRREIVAVLQVRVRERH